MNQQTTSKERILKKVRQALTFKSKSYYQNIDLESNIFSQPAEESLAVSFAKNFTALQGQFIYCDNQFDCIDKLLDLIELKKIKTIYCVDEMAENMLGDSGIPYNNTLTNIDKMQVAVTGCESIIARTGTILFSNARNTRKLTIWPRMHIVIANLSQLVPDIKDAMQMVKNRYGRNQPSSLLFVSGPSTTTAIPLAANQFPKTTVGAVGPLEVYLFLIDDTKKI